jgi:hypothetical protein
LAPSSAVMVPFSIIFKICMRSSLSDMESSC